VQILIPAAFPSILVGMRIGWPFAWRTLIAAGLKTLRRWEMQSSALCARSPSLFMETQTPLHKEAEWN
jgi:ABC-type anion transport system duplicated permease subunit